MHIHIHKVELDASLVFLEAAISVSPMGAGEDFESTARTMEVENLSLDPPTMSIDLLQRFMGNAREHEVAKGEDEGIELNLGLSLGGRFCVEKSSNQLVRSSSIASCLSVAKVAKDDGDVSVPASAPAAHTELVRTSSLPVETEEEWRKRKELQTLRRMEAKRRRSEKQRSLRIDREGSGIGGGGGGSLSLEERKEIEVGLRERLEGEKSLSVVKRSSSSVVSQLRLFEWASAAASEAILGTGIDAALAKGKGRIGQPGSQGSMESKGGSSSGGSDLESKALQGSSGELSAASIQSLQEASSQDVGSSATKARGHMRQMAGSDMESPSKKVDSSRTRGREIRSNSMEDMPCVFTKGDGPNGRRVDGILYKYGKGEEVRIMCVCHGSFHSPAEFVEHAGGTDVDHPLKHIVVNPNSSSLL